MTSEKGGGNALTGPYNKGVDAYAHPTNGGGRCAKINIDPVAVPTTCPDAADRTTWYLPQPFDAVAAAAGILGVPVVPLVTQAALVLLVVTAEVEQSIIHA